MPKNSFGPVSSPPLLKPIVPISSNGLTCELRSKGYETDPVGWAPPHLFEQQSMLHIVKVGAQVHVDDTSLFLDNRLCHSVHRLMSCSFRSVSVRSRLE